MMVVNLDEVSGNFILHKWSFKKENGIDTEAYFYICKSNSNLIGFLLIPITNEIIFPFPLLEYLIYATIFILRCSNLNLEQKFNPLNTNSTKWSITLK